ncbi:MAG: pentapeptide repeat-containing protein, partial [Alphaproteobacteria bacterium]
AKFFGTNLRGADFTGAKMRGADFFTADLSGATWTNGKTVCAEGSIGQCN